MELHATPSTPTDTGGRSLHPLISQFKGALDLWPTLVEVCYFHKNRKGLPMTQVKNQKKD
jgi:hypothetical protein